MIYELDKIKRQSIINLPFDSIITGKFTRGIYTHWSYEEPMFLMFGLINDKWVCLDFYCVGTRSLVETINKRDLKIFKEKDNDNRN
jgi:hypothetical protein